MGSFWTNYIMFELKTYRGVMFHGTEEWHKIWRKTDMWFGKLYNKFRKFLPEHSKDSNKDFDGILLSKTENEYAYREVMYMTINNDTKNEEELTCRFKIDMKNVANFRPSTRKFQKFAL